MNNGGVTQPDTQGFMVSAPWRSSGKTVLSIGLASALRNQLNTDRVDGAVVDAVVGDVEQNVQTFKKGPDFIDPLWLKAASGQPCYNLDFRQQSREEILGTYHTHTLHQGIALVEGTMGLHDGVAEDGSDSNAAMAALLGLPIVLVVDCRGMHRSVAALVNGIQTFDPELSFAGVVLNRVRSARHQQKIESALDTYTKMKVLGALPESSVFNIDERELGLLPVTDCQGFEERIEAITSEVSEHVNVSDLVGGARTRTDTVPVLRSPSVEVQTVENSTAKNTRIGIARDAAFHFYYQDDIDEFESRGVELVECSPCTGDFPTFLDGFWIGGGFPERHASCLVENLVFREAFKEEIVNGLPVHAECAGLMYLCNDMTIGEAHFPMVGVIDATVSMCQRPQGRGYMVLSAVGDDDGVFPAHEFHHSSLNFHSTPEFVYKVKRGHGVNGKHDGIQCNNVIASYAHFRHTRRTPWIDHFLKRVEKRKQNPAGWPQNPKINYV